MIKMKKESGACFESVDFKIFIIVCVARKA
jgi:hypothetical protein